MITRFAVTRAARNANPFLTQDRGPATVTKKPFEPFGSWLRRRFPKDTWDWRHLVAAQEKLDGVTLGLIPRLMISLPPRHGKSHMTTIRYPVYRLDQDPSTRVMLGCYSADLASEFSIETRRFVAETQGLSNVRAKATDWKTNAGGGMRAAGVGGGFTGRGGDLLIIDDPVKTREEAESPAYRRKVYNWYKSDFFSRREPGCAIILIMTRWHEDDLAGRLIRDMKNGADKWEILELPALAEKGDPLGREEGEALCPERFPVEELRSIERVMGPYDFASLYQQKPQPPESAMFKSHYFEFSPFAPKGLRWVRYWDLALSQKQTADYVASVAIALDETTGTLWIRDGFCDRVEMPDQPDLILSTASREPGVEIGIEEAQHGLGIIQALRRNPKALSHTIRGISVDTDKMARAAVWAPYGREKRIKIVNGGWVAEFLEQVLKFPVGAHDDYVDSVSGGIRMLGGGQYSGGYGVAGGKHSRKG